jgi:hypothetical protein
VLSKGSTGIWRLLAGQIRLEKTGMWAHFLFYVYPSAKILQHSIALNRTGFSTAVLFRIFKDCGSTGIGCLATSAYRPIRKSTK